MPLRITWTSLLVALLVAVVMGKEVLAAEFRGAPKEVLAVEGGPEHEHGLRGTEAKRTDPPVVDAADIEEDCAICQQQMNNGDPGEKGPWGCDHSFHAACLDALLEHSYTSPQPRLTCPTCRAPLNLESGILDPAWRARAEEEEKARQVEVDDDLDNGAHDPLLVLQALNEESLQLVQEQVLQELRFREEMNRRAREERAREDPVNAAQVRRERERERERAEREVRRRRVRVCHWVVSIGYLCWYAWNWESNLLEWQQFLQSAGRHTEQPSPGVQAHRHLDELG